MRFRRPEWDVPLPPALVSYWEAWNETDLDKVAGHLRRAVVEDVEWHDPRDAFVGIAELEAAIHRLRSTKPEYRFRITSEIDSHNDRYRYRWDMYRGKRTLMEGLDVATIDPGAGRVIRVDGFFGHPTAIKAKTSGVPHHLSA